MAKKGKATAKLGKEAFTKAKSAPASERLDSTGVQASQSAKSPSGVASDAPIGCSTQLPSEDLEQRLAFLWRTIDSATDWGEREVDLIGEWPTRVAADSNLVALGGGLQPSSSQLYRPPSE